MRAKAVLQTDQKHLRPRLAVVVSHPIQYFAPLYRALAASGEVDLKVLYCSRIGLDRFHDPGMGVELAWDMDLLGGYSSEFLPEASSIRTIGWRELDNPSMTAALDAFRPDAVVMHGYARKSLMRALLWCGRKRVPAMLISDSTTGVGRGGLRQTVKRALLPHLLGRYAAILTMSERSDDYFAAYGVPRDRLLRVPIMIDERFWSARSDRQRRRAAVRAELSLAEHDLVLAYVGKIYDTKRVGDLLAAAARIGSDRAKLLIVGDGELRPTLEAEARALGLDVRFTGFVNMSHIADYYASADVLVHPAELEQFGMVAIEAAIVGLPMILSDHVGAVGATSIARPGENALVYPCGDVDALAAAIRRLLDEPETRAAMAKASLDISLEHDGSKSVAAVVAAVERNRRRPSGLLRDDRSGGAK